MAVSNKNNFKKQPHQFYTLREEIANGVTHGMGAGLSIAGLTVLLSVAGAQGDTWRTISVTIYGGALVLLYLASTLYHTFQSPRVKRIFRVIDHASIYLLIAGTYTPFLLVSMRDAWGWTLFAIVWSLALTGVVFKVFWVNRFNKLSTVVYILMGWLCVLALQQLLVHIPLAGVTWLISGGVVYTVGVIFYVWSRFPYNHAIWHIFVLGGSICHYVAIVVYVLPGS